MIYDISYTALVFFFVFVGLVLGLSFYFGRKTNSSSSYYAAGGQIHWGVNGIAFAGDYLSAASFLGICGMIAISGFDGFLYAIGFLGGWIVALFLIAEPFKRLGKYTFTDALNAKFNSRAITLSASISTLIVSIFYLIPQMVGAGDLVIPLLGMPHWAGVLLVGAIVIVIVASAGMASTTYVQFLKGGLLIVLSLVLTFFILKNGLTLTPDFEGSSSRYTFMELTPHVEDDEVISVPDWAVVTQQSVGSKTFVKLSRNGTERWFDWTQSEQGPLLKETLTVTQQTNGETLYNGEPKDNRKFYQVGHMSKIVVNGQEVQETGAVGPFEFLSTIQDSELVRFIQVKLTDGTDDVALYYQEPTSGENFMLPGLRYKIGSDANLWSKLDFISLMLALFLGTAALPHILIRYYTVKTPRDARKSTILAIAAIGGFYLLTLFMGLGSAVNGVLDVESSNMAAPLLARAFGAALFSIISAVAFATVLGTVSGLIVASSGAIAHDFIDVYLKRNLSDDKKVKAGKIAALAVGVFAIALGMAFKGINVSFLVGWAFAIAASANLPAILFLLFWTKTSETGIAASIIVGIVASLAIILTSPTMWAQYGLDPTTTPHQLENPALISFPLAVVTVYVVSLLYPKKNRVVIEKPAT